MITDKTEVKSNSTLKANKRKRKSEDGTPSKSNFELIKSFIPYYSPYKKIFFTDLFSASLTTVCELALPLIIAAITDRATGSPVSLTFQFLAMMTVLYLALRVTEVVARYYMQSIGHIMGASIEKDMRRQVYGHLQSLPHAFFTTNRIGQIMARITTDLFDIAEFAHHCPEEYFIGLIKLIVSFVILLFIDVPLTLILFSMIPVMLYFSGKFRRRMRQTQMQQRMQIGELNANIEDSLLGVQVVKSFANEDIEEEKFEVGNDKFLNIKKRFYYSLAGFHSVTRIFDGLMYAIVIFFGGWSLLSTRITSGDFLAFILYVSTLLTTVARIVEFSEQFERGMTALERFQEILAVKSDIVDPENPVTLDTVKGDIKFSDVSFRYPDHDELVLENLNLNIAPGEKVAIVGPSGSGKTTLSNLVPRFYDVSSGSITVDGVDIRDFSLKNLRSHIGIVQQDVYLFGGSIRENIEYGKPGATDLEIETAAKLAGAYDFIMDLDGGFDAYVGERGIKLSGGQKQRISIARVFLKNPPILILDEATSALDNKSEKIVQNSLDTLSVGRTTVTIAHRLSTIRNADTILVLTERGIEEQGDHETLMARHGIYYDLYQVIENQELAS